MCLSLPDIEWSIHLICSPLAHWIACTNLNMPLSWLVFWILTLCSLQVNNNMLEEPVIFIFRFKWLGPSFTLEWSKLRMWFGCISSVARNVANQNHDREDGVHFCILTPITSVSYLDLILQLWRWKQHGLSQHQYPRNKTAWCQNSECHSLNRQHFANLKTCWPLK